MSLTIEQLQRDVDRLQSKVDELIVLVAQLDYLKDANKNHSELNQKQGYAIGGLREARTIQGRMIAMIVETLKRNDIDVPVIHIQNNTGTSTGIQGKGNQIDG